MYKHLCAPEPAIQMYLEHIEKLKCCEHLAVRPDYMTKYIKMCILKELVSDSNTFITDIAHLVIGKISLN